MASKSKQYKVTLTGQSPLLMHRDNLAYGERISKWAKQPENKAQSKAGDDRSPAWTWIGYLYHDDKHVGMDSDNLMTMLREGGSKVVAKGKETFKRQTQSGIMVDQLQWDIQVEDGRKVPVKELLKLIENGEFSEHMELAEKLGFELFVKRAKIGQSKHVRVRPMFRHWSCSGTVTVHDDEVSGLTKEILETILRQAGSLCGLGDWRPSSPKASGTFGRFTAQVELVK